MLKSSPLFLRCRLTLVVPLALSILDTYRGASPFTFDPFGVKGAGFILFMRIRGEREVQKFKMALEPQRGTTGDMKNNVLKLLREIKRMKLQIEPDTQG